MGGLFSDVGDYVKATFGEVGHHPLQAAGAALGIPGYDPFFGGLFNNHKGGALISPTGNFTSSAWNEMYKDNPNSTTGLNAFHKVNSVADIVAPIIAGGFASGAIGGAGSAGSGGGSSLFGLGGGGGSLASDVGGGAGAGGFTGLWSGPAAYGDAGLTGTVSGGGSGLGTAMGGDLGGSLGEAPTGLFGPMAGMGGGMTGTSSGALGGGLSGEVAGASPIGGASMGGYGSTFMNLAQQLLQQQSKNSQQQSQAAQGRENDQLPAAQNSGSPDISLALAAVNQQGLNQRLAQMRQDQMRQALGQSLTNNGGTPAWGY